MNAPPLSLCPPSTAFNPLRHHHIRTQNYGESNAAWESSSTPAPGKLSAQITFLELIISFYGIYLSAVIVCQSYVLATQYEVECKFCLSNSSLCRKKREGGRAWGFTFTITVVIQSSLIIILLPGMSAAMENRLYALHTKKMAGIWLQAEWFQSFRASLTLFFLPLSLSLLL